MAGPSSHQAALDAVDLERTDLFVDDAHEAVFDLLRANDPVHHQRGATGAGAFWNVTRYDDVLAVDTNHTVFAARDSTFMEDMPDDFVVSMFLSMDPPQHTVYRDALRPAFSAQHIATLEASIRERTTRILDSLPFGETFDWVSRVSIELTSHVLAALFDFPVERRHKLVEWSDLAVLKTLRQGSDAMAWEERKASFLACLQEFSAIRDARAHGDRTDLVSLLANSHQPRGLKPSEFLGNLLMLMFAGNDTTRNSISGSVLAFHRFPDQLERLRADASLLPSAMQEVFRWQTPVAYMRRVAAMETELRGKRIKAGDKVVIWYAAGNRDASVFPDPHRFDIGRANASRHLAFGYGVHRCIGVRLAELQMRVLWEEILQRFDRVEVVDRPDAVRSNFIKGYSTLPVRLVPRTR